MISISPQITAQYYIYTCTTITSIRDVSEKITDQPDSDMCMSNKDHY